MRCFVNNGDPRTTTTTNTNTNTNTIMNMSTPSVTVVNAAQVDMDCILTPLPPHFLSSAFTPPHDPAQASAEVTSVP